MGSSYYTNPVEFLINTLFGIYILAVMLRFLLQWVRADFYNPVSQFLVKVTNPPLLYLRRVIPGYGGIDLASVVLMLLLQLLNLFFIFMLRGVSPGIGSLLILSVAELLALAINVFLGAIIIQVILSWINPGAYNPLTSILYSLTEPLLRPARGMIPSVSGIDFSPLIVLIVLQLGKMILIPPLLALA